jgi:hypothetical protein
VSALGGQGAKATVTEVSELVTGEIEFAIEEGGFGYTLANTTLAISNQAFLVYEDELANTPTPLGEVSASNSAIYDISSNTALGETLSGIGTFVAYEHPLLYVSTDSAANSFNAIPSNSYTSVYIEGVGNATISAVSPYPDDVASYEIGDLSDAETVSVITDIIGNFANTTLDSADYGMSGANSENTNTAIIDAFTATELTIGTISSLLVNSPGFGYTSPVRSYLSQDNIVVFDKRDIGIVFNSPTFVIEAGEVVTQSYSLDIISGGSVETIQYTAKAKFIRRVGDIFYFRPTSFYGFDENLPVKVRGSDYSVLNIVRDASSDPMGLNAVVEGEISNLTGQILSVSVYDTGFRYQDGEEVDIVNPITNEVLGSAIVEVRGMGYGEGRWETSTSFLNDPSKVIRDNFYYQEYSYDISTIINPNDFVEISKNAFHVAGTKQFTSSLINSQNNIGPSIDGSIEVEDV